MQVGDVVIVKGSQTQLNMVIRALLPHGAVVPIAAVVERLHDGAKSSFLLTNLVLAHSVVKPILPSVILNVAMTTAPYKLNDQVRNLQTNDLGFVCGIDYLPGTIPELKVKWNGWSGYAYYPADSVNLTLVNAVSAQNVATPKPLLKLSVGDKVIGIAGNGVLPLTPGEIMHVSYGSLGAVVRYHIDWSNGFTSIVDFDKLGIDFEVYAPVNIPNHTVPASLRGTAQALNIPFPPGYSVQGNYGSPVILDTHVMDTKNGYKSRKCECGAHKVNSNQHSDWCDLFVKVVDKSNECNCSYIATNRHDRWCLTQRPQ